MLVLGTSGCDRPPVGRLADAGWYQLSRTDRDSAGSFLAEAAANLESDQFEAHYRSDLGTTVVRRKRPMTEYTFTVQRAGHTVTLTLFQYDPADNLHFPRSIVCGPDLALRAVCRDVTLDLLGSYFTEQPLPENFYGIAFADIFSHTHPQVLSPAHWRTLAGLARTPLNLTRTSRDGIRRLGLEDRVYVSGALDTPAGTARCVGWFDAIEDIRSGYPRGGWCQRSGVWFGDVKGTTTLVKLRHGPQSMRFPAPVQLPAVDATLTPEAGRLFHLAYPEFPKGFLTSLTRTPQLPA